MARMDPTLKKEFKEVCERRRQDMSEVLRVLAMAYIAACAKGLPAEADLEVRAKTSRPPE